MSAVEIIVAALAAGAGAGTTNVASAAIQDAYTGLKNLLRSRLDDRTELRAALDADEVDADVWQARIGTALYSSGAVDDDTIVAAAKRLLALADPVSSPRFDIQVETNNGGIGHFSGPVTFNQGAVLPPPQPGA